MDSLWVALEFSPRRFLCISFKPTGGGIPRCEASQFHSFVSNNGINLWTIVLFVPFDVRWRKN